MTPKRVLVFNFEPDGKNYVVLDEDTFLKKCMLNLVLTDYLSSVIIKLRRLIDLRRVIICTNFKRRN